MIQKIEKKFPFEKIISQMELNKENMCEIIEMFKYIYEHGLRGGVHGFITLKQTGIFFEENKKEILEYLEDKSQENGVSLENFIWGITSIKSLKELLEEGEAILLNDIVWWYIKECANYIFEILIPSLEA